jgi:hypothetical protein
MTAPLTLRPVGTRALEIATAEGALLWRYVYAPETPGNESPRPYAHPVCSLAGDILTEFRPEDHRWHHALSLTLTRVNGVNFWGGPSYRAEDGYQERDDHGRQHHVAWHALAAGRLDEELEWSDRATGRVLLRERRVIVTTLGNDAWSLRWTSELRNATEAALMLENYHSSGGLAGSHYTGLQFRGARSLLGAPEGGAVQVSADGGLAGEAAVHGVPARAMEWLARPAGQARAMGLRFEHLAGPLPWFVRAKNPLAAFAFHREHPVVLSPGASLHLDHLLTFFTR